MYNTDVVIIGGGAAGLMAACAAGRYGYEYNTPINITILEKNDRVGRKLISTGNGRCNLSNADMHAGHFHGSTPTLIKSVLDARTLDDTLVFFSKIGLHTTIEDGRIYPYSQTAASVLDTMRFETEHFLVRTITDFEVLSALYDSTRNVFIINGGNEIVTAKMLIIATGGKAAPSTGSDGAGVALLSRFGHTVKPMFPALSPLTVRHPMIKSLKGIRLKPCRLTVYANRQVLASDAGELLFTEYGFSGIPAMQVSAALNGHDCLVGNLDVIPHMSDDDLYAMLRERRKNLSHVSVEHFFTGLLHKRVGWAILREANIDTRLTDVASLTDKQLLAISGAMKHWPFEITGVKGFTFAQATGGGVSLSEFHPETMESIRIPGLYAAGEVLDIYGDCGGYNLHWAWTTGYLAGRSAGAAVHRSLIRREDTCRRHLK